MINAPVDSNSKVSGLPLTTRWVDVEWVNDIPVTLDSTKTILAFACPTIVKEGRLALILYYSDGPRAMRPHWMIAALARSSHANGWQSVVQRGPIFGDLY